MYIPDDRDVDDERLLIALLHGLRRFFHDALGLDDADARRPDAIRPVIPEELQSMLRRDDRMTRAFDELIAAVENDARPERIFSLGLSGELLRFKARSLRLIEASGRRPGDGALSAIGVRDLVNGGRSVVKSAVEASGAGEVLGEVTDFADMWASDKLT